ncbi:hypothetical protein [Streptomyces boncukensis]|uniref:Uncharacterized protein n=1 Tax=Streptomyces boncukensis TaxID=2711219 RepID=A0A6G4X801_9ACTN|nr:hypothetical protein [Streptomyces boncukensis]NGO72977.1 hypothetical protein [Streptomyces boncukensis]
MTALLVFAQVAVLGGGIALVAGARYLRRRYRARADHAVWAADAELWLCCPVCPDWESPHQDLGDQQVMCLGCGTTTPVGGAR